MKAWMLVKRLEEKGLIEEIENGTIWNSILLNVEVKKCYEIMTYPERFKLFDKEEEFYEGDEGGTK